MLEATARKQVVCGDQRLDHPLVGVALLALVVDDAGRIAGIGAEARCILGIKTVVIHGERDARGNAARFQGLRVAHPDFKVIAAMARRGVHKARAGIVGDVVAIEQRDGEAIERIESSERVGTGDRRQRFRRNVTQPRVSQLGFLERFCSELVSKDQLFTGLRSEVVFGRCDLVEAIADLRRERDRAVAGDGPRRRRPDDD